ncbi:Zinc finger protein AZF2 [Sesamum alatum]|uniref:Zinc finger protein AZF2 n=1 Tax=Sesamum alatum TaxID=300844 RepID=A0AAE1XT51_9LAMI|nr:Zinc finger protein AZF2 [Sesamum alatum]
MGEVQGQRYVCKICSKSCVSGKSLGGHMRVHLALISASKKAAKKRVDEIKVEFEEDDDDDDGSFQLQKSSKNQSNSALPDEERIKNCDRAMDLGDGDQNNSYELRENPKKSWRISDSKTGVSKIRAACKECGKEFPSLRALSGHMRSHSIKNRKLHQCKECGKGFDSMRAMFGHMKTHSKRSSRVPDESADSLSELENLCPLRRKRSRIGYKSSSNPSLSSLNASTSAVSEAGEVEEVAKCLMMLSSGVKVWRKFDLLAESSDDDSVYFGAESSYENDEDFGCDGHKKMKMSLSTGKLDCSVPCSRNAFAGRNVSEFDDLDSRWSAEDEMKVEFEVSDETKVDLKVSDDGQPSVHKLMKLEELNDFAVGLEYADDSRSSDSTRFAEPHNDLLGATGIDGAGSDFFKFDSPVDQSGFSKYSSKNEADDLETLKDFVIKHRTCDKFFHSHRELGGHGAGHKLQGNSSSMHTTPSLLSITVADSKLDQFECIENQLEQDSAGNGIVSLESSKSKEHECPICFKVFPSGQALGGHKRAHYTGSNESKTNETTTVIQEVAEVHNLLDLNFPVTADEGTKSDVGLNLWWADRSHEHEALVLTN